MHFRCHDCDTELEVEITKIHWSTPVGEETAIIRPCTVCTVRKEKAEEMREEYSDNFGFAYSQVGQLRELLDKAHAWLGDIEEYLDDARDKDPLEDVR